MEIIFFLKSIKDGISDFLYLDKWVLHVILGLFIWTVLVFLSKKRLWASLAVLCAIVGLNEVIDFVEAIASHKIITVYGVAEDIVLSVAIPLCLTVIFLAVDKRASSAKSVGGCGLWKVAHSVI